MTWFFRTWRTPLAATALFISLLFAIMGYSDVELSEVALQEGTLSKHNSKIGSHPIRNDVWPMAPEWDYWKRLLPLDAPSLVIWMGNSHLHAINGMQDGEQVSSYELHVLLNGMTWPGEYPVFGLSIPNLSFEEQFLLTLWLTRTESLPRPLIIVSGYRYADTRTSNIRPVLKPLITDESIKDWIVSHGDLAEAFPVAFNQLRKDAETYRLQLEKESEFETKLRRFIGRYVYLFEVRTKIGGNIRLMLNDLRNWILRIDTKSKRGILTNRYAVSMEFMELAAYVCRENGVKLLMYNLPLRPDVKDPYPDEPYSRYRNQMQTIAENYGENAAYRDYEKVIPVPDWGTFYATTQPDYSHFKASGHMILAQRVAEDLESTGFLVRQ